MSVAAKDGPTSGTVTVLTVGGLGNQLYTMAAGLSYARQTGRSFRCVRTAQSDSCFSPRPVYWATLFKQVPTAPAHAFPATPTHAEAEAGYRAIPAYLGCPDVSIRGYLQDPQYFDKDRACVLETFFPNDLVCDAAKLLPPAPSQQQWAFVHFRRGDYKRIDNGSMVLSLAEYYEPAAQLFPASVAFLVFCEPSDRDDVARELRDSPAFRSRTVAFADTSIPDYLQLLMMACCPSGGIIANSTFSVWAGYAREHPAVQQIHNQKPVGALLYTIPKNWRMGNRESDPRALPQWLPVGRDGP